VILLAAASSKGAICLSVIAFDYGETL